MSLTRRSTSAGAAALAGLLLLAACGSGDETAGTTSPVADASSSSAPATSDAAPTGSVVPSTPGSATEVKVTVTEAEGCVAEPDTVPAGPVTFVVVNQDSTGVTEVELVAEQRILGERENLTPGFESTFSVRVDGGSYEIFCPGATVERKPFTVTGEAAQASGDVAELLDQAAIDYATYIDDQVAFLVEPVAELQAAIDADDVEAAKLAYAKARPFYERIEPVAESFPDLDPAIDLRIGDVEEGVEWTGFHPIEQDLFEKGAITATTKELAAKLVDDVAELQRLTGELSAATVDGSGDGYQAFEIANGASGLLDEVLLSKITGEEEAYSKLDLLDFEANVEGSLQAFATLKPALDQIDPTVVPTIASAFDDLTLVLNDYKDPAALGGWTPYDALTDADKKKLTDSLLVVQEPLSAVAQKITQ